MTSGLESWPPIAVRTWTHYDEPKTPFPIDPYLQKQLMDLLLKAKSRGDYTPWNMEYGMGEAGNSVLPPPCPAAAEAIQNTPPAHQAAVAESLASLTQQEMTGCAPKDSTATISAVVINTAQQGAIAMPTKLADTVTDMVPSLTSTPAQDAPGQSVVTFKATPPGLFERVKGFLKHLFTVDHGAQGSV